MISGEPGTARGERIRETAPEVLDHIFSLPFQAQLGILRTLASKVFARLLPEQREGFLRDLTREIERTEQGGGSYDLRPQRHPSRGEALSEPPRPRRSHGEEWLADPHFAEPSSEYVGVAYQHRERPPSESRAALAEHVEPFMGQRADAWPRSTRTPRGFARIGPRGYVRSDERIREDVCEALGRAEQLDPSDLEVTVTDGEVRLEGSVPARALKYWVEQLCERVAGVRDVHNLLRVLPPERPRARHEARAEATYHRFLDRLVANLGVPAERAEEIALAVLSVLEQRLTPAEAMDLEAQLPSRLQELLSRCAVEPQLRPRDLDRARFTELVARRLRVRRDEADVYTRGVFHTLDAQVSPGELRQVRHLLPPDLRALWAS